MPQSREKIDLHQDRLAAKTRRARLRVRPPINPVDLERFESEFGVALPGDYRDFLLRVANGGRSPCRLVPLKDWFACYWIDEPKPSMVAQPCVITLEAEKHGRDWLDKTGVADWSNRWDCGEWDPMFGTIAVAEIGCGLFFSMIMTGPLRGRLFAWGDHAENPPEVLPETSFGEWFERCLDAMITGEPVHFLDGRLQ